MNYFKTFETYTLDPQASEFAKKIEKWNENFSSLFIFQKNRATVPDDLETEEAPERNGATYSSIIQVALSNLAELLKDYPLSQIVIEVHTDDTTPDGELWDSNDELSQARAKNIKNYLVSKGAKAENIKAEGKGFSEPLIEDSKDNDEAKKKNKRVVLVAI
jgi:flagellar motor protein MotB